MKKQSFILVATSVALLAAIFAYRIYGMRKAKEAMAAMRPPPVTVSAAAVRTEAWPHTLSAVGSLASSRGILIKSEVDGLIREVLAVSGQRVEEGTKLVRLDTSVEEAQLAGLVAQTGLAEINLKRARELRADGTNTPNDLDTAEANLAVAAAAVAEVRAVIAKKHVVAPFGGWLGIIKVYPGGYLNRGDPIVALESIDPIHLDFSLTQQEIAQVSEDMPVVLAVDAYPDRKFRGRITAISPLVVDATRSLDLRATFDNADGLLRPGMFARAEVVRPSTEQALVVPSTAIVHNPYGETVYVVEGSIAHQRFVKIGPSRGDLTQVLEGLSAQDQVVTSGQIKLRNGSEVRIDNSVAPSSDPTPLPKES